MKAFRSCKLDSTFLCMILLVFPFFVSPAFSTVRDVTTFGATGDGSHDDTAAIKAAIGAMVGGDELLFPCGASGVYKITSGLTLRVQNATINGQTGCNSGRVMIKGSFSGGTLLLIGGGSFTATTPLLQSQDALDNSLLADASSLGGLSPGDLLFAQEGGVDPPSDPTQCDISGCRGEIVKVASVSGDTVNLTTTLHFDYSPSVNAARVAKLTSVVSNCNVHDLTLDGSGTVSTGLTFTVTDSCTATNITAQNFTATAMQGYRNWSPSWNSITVTHSGTNGGPCAANLYTDGDASINGMTLNNLNTGAFGMCFSQGGGGTFTGLSVDKAGSGTGRAVKTIARAYSTWNNLTVANTSSGYNGFDFEYYSAHDTVNTCNFTANSTGGIVTFGNYNDFLTINNCTMVMGANGSQTGVAQALSGLGRRDHDLTISGGNYSGASGHELIFIGGSNAYIHDATIGSGTQGIGVGISGLTGLCFNNNIFASGMVYSYSANGATASFANGNTLGSAVSGTPLPTGSCGTTSALTAPTAPTGLTATVH